MLASKKMVCLESVIFVTFVQFLFSIVMVLRMTMMMTTMMMLRRREGERETAIVS